MNILYDAHLKIEGRTIKIIPLEEVTPTIKLSLLHNVKSMLNSRNIKVSSPCPYKLVFQYNQKLYSNKLEYVLKGVEGG